MPSPHSCNDATAPQNHSTMISLLVPRSRMCLVGTSHTHLVHKRLDCFAVMRDGLIQAVRVRFYAYGSTSGASKASVLVELVEIVSTREQTLTLQHVVLPVPHRRLFHHLDVRFTECRHCLLQLWSSRIRQPRLPEEEVGCEAVCQTNLQNREKNKETCG